MPSKPRVTFADDYYRFQWEDEQVEMVVERLSERKGSGLVGELTVTTSAPPQPGVLYPGKNWNLNTSNASVAKELGDRLPVDWKGMLDQASAIAKERYREGEPLIDLGGERERRVGPRFLLPGLIERSGPTSWFADGGSGKSMLALGAAVSVATGIPVLGDAPLRCCPVVYLDWETDRETFEERVDAIWRGLGETTPFPPGLIYYREQVASLAESAPTLRRKMAETGAGLVVCDSVGMARGGDPNEGEGTIRYFNAARSLRLPTLNIDHVSKDEMRKKGGPTQQVGNRYSHNASRLSWGLTSQQDEGSNEIVAAMRCVKGSNVGKQRNRGYRIAFENETDQYGDQRLVAVRFENADLRDYPELGARSQKYDIANAIQSNGGYPMKVKEIAAATGISEARVKTVLNENDWFTSVGKDGRETLWALLSEEREESFA